MTDIHDKILPAGTQIGVYEIKDALKVGAFEITYRAWNRHLKEWINIQEYFPHDFAIRTSDGLGVESKSAGDKENFDYGLKAFLDQAEVLTQIEHFNIAVAENVLQFNGTAYLMMGIPKGVSLSKLVQLPTTLAETELKFILVSILTALQKVHEHKIVHGGIRPAAIILAKDGEPLLTDFAAARLAIAARTAQFADELAAGYAPAEQYEPAKEPGPATDFYALGATIYYCMTHQQPVVAQSRKIIVSTGGSDPMTLPSESVDAGYSKEFLQVIKWMLQPVYDHRPQSASEILALLKPEQANDQTKSSVSRQAVTDVANRNKNPLWIGAAAGVAVLATIAVWLNEKTVEIVDDESGIVTTQLPLQRQSERATVTIKPETKADQPATSAADETHQASGSEKISEAAQKTMHKGEKQLAENASVAVGPSATEPQSDSDQKPALLDQSPPRPGQSNLSPEPADLSAIKKHLAAAEKAMRIKHFTTPLKDNAYKYYQMVFALDPDNAEALAGLQRIVDRYIQFIGKARIDGRIHDAKLYLQRAESVLPDDPRLQGIRAELAVAE